MQQFILNEHQKSAVSHFKGPMLVLAGPGSGKTTVITYRLGYLIKEKGVNPKDILVITFTKAAATEMSQRFKQLIGENPFQLPTFSTFHAYFFRILRSAYGYSTDNVLHEDERRQALKQIVFKSGLEMETDEEFFQSIGNEISLIKNELLDHRYYNSQTMGAEDFLNIYRAYETQKSEHNKIDFDDMLVKCHELLTERPEVLQQWQDRYKFILCDEFQDINRVQYETLKLLCPHGNIFVVGDDDQSIYRFRGARPDFLINFPKDFENAQQIILSTNYRSTEKLISSSKIIIDENLHRYFKDIKGTGIEGSPPKLLIFDDISEEAGKISKAIKIMSKKAPLDSFAVLYRTNIQSRAFIDAMLNQNLPFIVKDEFPTIYEHFVAKDIIAYMYAALDPANNGEYAHRIINKPTRYIKNVAAERAKRKKGDFISNLYETPGLTPWQLGRIDELLFYLAAIKKRTPFEAMRYIRQAVGYDEYLKGYAEYRKLEFKPLFEVMEELLDSSKGFSDISEYLSHVKEAVSSTKKVNQTHLPAVTLTTLHSSKGLEFNTVFIAGCVETVIPYEKSRTQAELEEERRLLYVGMTRAKNDLYISVMKNRYEAGVKPSRFLHALFSAM